MNLLSPKTVLLPIFTILLVTLICALLPSISTAQTVDEVRVDETAKGYIIEVKLFVPMRYHSHSPRQSGQALEIQLRNKNLGEFESPGRARKNLGWDLGSGAPIEEIILDTLDPETPSLVIQFTREVKFKVRGSADLLSIIIELDTDKLSFEEKASEDITVIEAENLVTRLKNSNPKHASLLQEANDAMLAANYPRAIQLFTKIRDEVAPEYTPHLQELLGVAREYNGQLAHAKAEYQRYLKDFPSDAGAERVRQRLNAIITASQAPRTARGRDQIARKGVDKKSEWNTQIFGGFAQTYYLDETTPEEEESILLRSDLVNDLDFVARMRKGDLDIRTQFIGGYRADLNDETGEDDSETLISIASIEATHSGIGLFGRLGRQSKTTEGVLGRFDGLSLSYDITDILTINTVHGFPVDIRDKEKINTDQVLHGVSFDLNNIWGGWDFNTYYLRQTHFDILDREAVGTEIRYFDSRRSIFTLVDWDINYDELNIFLFIGNWTVFDDTTFNVIVDKRKSPLLTTTNAIQGQGVSTLDQLFDRFSEEELTELARDRTSESESYTLGLTQRINDNWQFTAEATTTKFASTPASGGVEAIPGTGNEQFYSFQLLANSLLAENDIMILGLRFNDTTRSETYSSTINWRVNLGSKLRINPRVRVDFRQDKDDDDDRWLVRPFIRIDYRFKRWMKFEADFGYEWLDETFAGRSQETTGYFLSIGYRANF